MAAAPAEASGAEASGPLSTLQVAVLQRAAQGLSTDEIAAALALEPAQVRQALLAILRQLGAHSKLGAILCADQLGLLGPGPQDDDSR